MSKFNAGDRVRALVTECDVKAGNEYEVVDTDGSRGHFIHDDVGDKYFMFDHEIELVTSKYVSDEPRGLQAGDSVKCVGNDSPKGLEGKAISFDGDLVECAFEGFDGHSGAVDDASVTNRWWCLATDLRLVEKEPASTPVEATEISKLTIIIDDDTAADSTKLNLRPADTALKAGDFVKTDDGVYARIIALAPEDEAWLDFGAAEALLVPNDTFQAVS